MEIITGKEGWELFHAARKEHLEKQIGTYQEPLLRGRGNGKGLLEYVPTEFNHLTNTQMQDNTMDFTEQESNVNFVIDTDPRNSKFMSKELADKLQSKLDELYVNIQQDGPFDGSTANDAMAGGNPEEESPKRVWPGHYWDQFYFILKELEQEYPTLPEESPFNTIRMSIHNTLELLSGNKEETTITIPFKVGQQVWAMEDNKPYPMTIERFEVIVHPKRQSIFPVLTYGEEKVQTTKPIYEVFPTKEALLASL
jgi:hypothetical protein